MFAFLISTLILYAFISPFIQPCKTIVSLSKSILIGVLYDKTFIEDEEVFENTLQFSLVFILISIIWDSER